MAPNVLAARGSGAGVVATAAAGARALMLLLLTLTAANSATGRAVVRTGQSYPGARSLAAGFAHAPTLTHRRSPPAPAPRDAAAATKRPAMMQALFEKAMMLAPARVITEVSEQLCC